jgi:hypothetical protein
MTFHRDCEGWAREIAPTFLFKKPVQGMVRSDERVPR